MRPFGRLRVFGGGGRRRVVRRVSLLLVVIHTEPVLVALFFMVLGDYLTQRMKVNMTAYLLGLGADTVLAFFGSQVLGDGFAVEADFVGAQGFLLWS